MITDSNIYHTYFAEKLIRIKYANGNHYINLADTVPFWGNTFYSNYNLGIIDDRFFEFLSRYKHMRFINRFISWLNEQIKNIPNHRAGE